MIVQLLISRLAALGYASVLFSYRTEDAYYFNAVDSDKDIVFIKVEIDDETTFDDWAVFDQYEGSCTWNNVQ